VPTDQDAVAYPYVSWDIPTNYLLKESTWGFFFYVDDCSDAGDWELCCSLECGARLASFCLLARRARPSSSLSGAFSCRRTPCLEVQLFRALPSHPAKNLIAGRIVRRPAKRPTDRELFHVQVCHVVICLAIAFGGHNVNWHQVAINLGDSRGCGLRSGCVLKNETRVGSSPASRNIHPP
jgi:hypothetical protein